MLTPQIKRLVSEALQEDLGSGGDLTSRAVLRDGDTGSAAFVAREPMMVAGLEVVREVFGQLDLSLELETSCADGDLIDEGHSFAAAKGPIGPMLAAERTALNFLQHLSAIATKTYRWVEILAPYETRLLDTRKTLPGWRALQKWAVRTGGGVNHRFGLFDGILIKDNHIRACHGVAEAIKRIRDHYPYHRIEIEISNRQQAEMALREGADILLLDNMTPEQCASIVELARDEALTEASGRMDEARLVAYAQSGVDFISAGALTHTVRAVDIAMKI